MASNLLNIVYQEPKPIDEEKLKFLCTKRNTWGHFKISSDQFNSIPEQGRMKLFYCFYNDLEPAFFFTKTWHLHILVLVKTSKILRK